MKIIALIVLMMVPAWVICQGNYNVTDPEKDYKEAQEYFIKGQYSLAYPLLKELAKQYPENTQSSHTNINENIDRLPTRP